MTTPSELTVNPTTATYPTLPTDPNTTKSKYTYEYLPHLFTPTEWDTDKRKSFGLKSSDWDEFNKQIEELKGSCASNESIKIIYAARHGEAEHNRAESLFRRTEGRKACHVPDPVLTAAGVNQAIELAHILQSEISKGMPTPNSWVGSPLRRALETGAHEWGWKFGHPTSVGVTERVSPETDRPLTTGNTRTTKPVAEKFVQDLGEGRGDESQGVPVIVIQEFSEVNLNGPENKRRPLSEIKKSFPSATFPSDLTEDDALWEHYFSGLKRDENDDEVAARSAVGLEKVFDREDIGDVISLTGHNGQLRGVLKTLGVPFRSLVVGEMNPLVVKVTDTSKASEASA